MKKVIIYLALILSNFALKLNAQNCVNYTDTRETWTNIPYFDGSDSYIKMNELNANTTNNASMWLNGNFTLDFWIKATFPLDIDNEDYTIFSAGVWSDDYNSLYIFFEKYDEANDKWRIRFSDGYDSGSETDFFYYIGNDNYENNWYNKWRHLTITYDGGNDILKFYINGTLKLTHEFVFNQISTDYCMFGNCNDHTKDFRGYMSGFRVWAERTLTQNEVSYIWDKTFNGSETFSDTYAYLNNYLTINMFTDDDNIYSLVPNKSMLEHGITRSTNEFHPGRPINSSNLQINADYQEINLTWDRNSDYETFVVTRNGTLLCWTQDNNFTDNDANLQANTDYTYVIYTYTKNPTEQMGFGISSSSPEYVPSGDNLEGTASLKQYNAVQNLQVDDDGCDGILKLSWAPVTSPDTPPSYSVYRSIEDSTWEIIANNVTQTTYNDTIADTDLGKSIQYKVDANGDKVENFSLAITGIPNKPCTSVPTNVQSVVNGEQIDVTWDYTQVGAPATMFKVYGRESTGSYNAYHQVDINTTQFIDSTATMCVDWIYKVEAYNSCNVNQTATSSESNASYIPMVFDDIFTYTKNSNPDYHYFDASKGYYNQKIVLEWEPNTNKLNDIDQYEIYRKEPNGNYTPLTTIYNSNTNYYEDVTADANIMYSYLIRAVGDCNGTQFISDSLTTLGFRNSSGIVSGKVTYSGGNAVKDVEVRVSTEDQQIASSLYFNTSGKYIKSNKFTDDSIFYKPISVDAWIKPEEMLSGDDNTYFSIADGILYIGLRNMRPVFGVNQTNNYCTGNSLFSLEGDTTLQANTWYHIATNFSPDSGLVQMYLNGELIAQTTYINPTYPWATNQNCAVDFNNFNILIGRADTLTHNFYSGNIDELRIWQRFRTAEEIKQNYKRILTGKEDKLIGYYRFNENYGTSAYDLSQADDFNKNDFIVADNSDFPEWSLQVPSFEQLHPSGITDQNGNYIIKGINYTSSGNIYSVSPVLGVHEFNPNNVNLFIGDGQPVHNNIDFVDQSSFNFNATVYYYGTNIPVEGAEVYIDNVQQFDNGGYPIKTGNDGVINISVPIGHHYVSIKKENHYFVNNGQWPAPTQQNPYETFDFQDDVYGITFYDSTRVKVAGRFVGGDVEGDKKIGFGKSVANIGQGTIVLVNEQGLDINPDENIESSKIRIITNANTGEYEAELLPISYKIDSVYNDHYEMDNLDLGILDLSDVPEITHLTDTTIIEEIDNGDTTYTSQVESYDYHFKRNFIYYAEPTIRLMGENENDLIGDTVYYVTNPNTQETDTLDLKNNSPFNYPVFTMGKTYDIDIRVEARYYNYDSGTPIEDIVPVKNAQVTVTNNLEISEPTHTYITDENGMLPDYKEFRVGLPNMSMDQANGFSFTKTMTITANAGNYNISWNNGNVYRAYVLGAVDAGGVNYVTYGPELPQFILRDPPGDRSYTSLEQGSEYSCSQNFSFSHGGTSDFDNILMRGVKFEVGGGLAGPVVSSEVTSDLNAGFTVTNSISKSGEFVKTYTFNQTYSTSSDPEAVGSMADVYIGRSLNLLFTETQNLRIYPKSYCDTSGLDHLDNSELSITTGDYTIGKRPGFAVTEDQSSTSFVYTQDHILNNLLPTYRDLIYALLAGPKYHSKIPDTHPYYGLSNDAAVWADTIAATGDSLPSYEFLGSQGEIDSVAFLNQQISIWLQTIAFNEAAKLGGDFQTIENISFDGNAGAYTNEITSTTTDVTNYDYSYRVQLFGGATTGFTINKTGLMTYSQTYLNYDKSVGSSSSSQKKLKWKYVLDDSNQGDYYSVDVMRNSYGTWHGNVNEFLNSVNYSDMEPSNLFRAGAAFAIGQAVGYLVNPLAGQVVGMANTAQIAAAYMGKLANYADEIDEQKVYFGLQGASPIFKIVGGQSRCPYEGEETTAFYIDTITNEPYLLSPGTQQREVPKIEITPSSIVNVPDGSPAVFQLSMTNENSTNSDITYELLVDENANPDGAVMKIDGLNPNRPFFIPAGQTITKTLTVERGSSGQMNFDNLQLILHSSCQYNPDDNFPDIADTVAFSVHFVPVCTEVNIGNLTQNWVSNIYDNDTMNIEVTNYNVNQPTFQKVYFQYQQAGATPTTYMTLFNDTTGYASYTGNKMLINGQASVDFDFVTSSLNDGEYTLFLTTTCSDGSTFESEHLNGVIDRITPRPFGSPEPADGILSYGEDISVKFNEPINSGELYTIGQYGSASAIKVKGVLNGTDLSNSPYILHDANISFDGQNDNLQINNINLNNTDFTIEFWAKRTSLGEQTLLNLGNLILGYDASNHFTVSVDNQTISTDEELDQTDTWAFYSVSYQQGDENTNSTITITVLNGANTIGKTQEVDIYSSLEGVLYVGNNSENNNGFNGNMHELRIWDYARSATDISAEKSKILNGYEQGLYGLWHMNEASGNTVKDIASGRNAYLNATWQVSRNGKAISFDGTNHFDIPVGSMVFDNQSNFTVEFWFKSDIPSANATFLSNGTFSVDSNQNAWNIYATSTGNIVINNNQTDVTINAQNYLNNNWHHFAMSINRLGYLSVYIDGNLVTTKNASYFEGFGASKLVAGASWYYQTAQNHYDNYYTGVIDELRIWNCERTQNQIKRYMNYTLNGDEAGLKAYFPFEDVTIADPSISNQSANNFTLDTIAVAGNGTIDASYFTTESPNMKLQRPEVLIPHTLTINNDEVVITPNIEAWKIENQILDISIKNVKDMNNNKMSSTLSWNAFVDKNQVVWEIQELEISKYVEQDTTIYVNIRNNGGINENYQITNIPSWMEVSPSTGNLSPLQTESIAIRIKPELNIGSYQRDLSLVSSMNFNERLNIKVNVNGHAPDWTVDPADYTKTANIIGQLSIGDVISTDVNDIVACFVNGECRGVANVQYFATANIYLVFMNVYANTNGETMEFKVYDASTGEIYSNVSPQITFTENELYGSVSSPLPINATNYVEQNIGLNQGWNWISFNVYAPEFNDLNTAFENLHNPNRAFIKSQTDFASVLRNGNWYGSINGLNVTSTYKMKVSSAQNLVMEGYKVIPDTITIPIVQGWNWIGYPLSIQIPLNDALSSLTPQDDDIIKSQHQFAVYNSALGWIGSLEYLQPGKGYVLYSSTNGTLSYMGGISSKSFAHVNTDNDLPNTEDNMTIIAEAVLDNPLAYTINAVDKNGICGKAKPIELPDGTVRYFITINSNSPETIKFEAVHKNGSLQANEKISFVPNKKSGSLNKPVKLTFNGGFENLSSVYVYPNPFKDRVSISFTLNSKQNVQIRLFNAVGVQISSTLSLDLNKGYQEIDILKHLKLNNLNSGIYVLKLKINDKEEIVKLVKE